MVTRDFRGAIFRFRPHPPSGPIHPRGVSRSTNGIIEAAFALIGVIITAIVIPFIKSKTTVAQQQAINSWVRIAVAAAEQIYVGSGRGVETKAHVLSFLKSKGITLDVETVDAMIESAVYELTNGFIEIGAPVAGQEG